MTTPITKEQAEAVFDLRAGCQLGNADIDILRKLAEYALAAMGAEPVAYADPQALINFKIDEGKITARTREWMWRRPGEDLIPLYATPPAPVVTESADREMLKRLAVILSGSDAPGEIKSLTVTAASYVERCKTLARERDDARAAMLNHSENERDMDEPVSQPYKLPPNSFTNDDLEMMAHGDNPQANAYRELLVFRRNSPVIPDGWIPVSERLPEEDGNYWGWWSVSKRQGPVWFIKSDLQAQFQSSEITHWQPLPAAPQQEGK